MKSLLFVSLILLSTTSCISQRNIKNITERDGKIGIGTTSPDELLTVKGKIHTQEVLVDLNGAVAPDYVFENYFHGASKLKPDYTFPSLASVSKFVEQHHHLPNVPSAATLEKEGLSLKQMNLILLQKIEELTLYTIEQQKQLDLLNEKVKQLDIKE
ncbi:MAG: hypothetical protein ACI86C_000651 [Candidatus Latescibacterota bacterium]|jgi:hypothetical protein